MVPYCDTTHNRVLVHSILSRLASRRVQALRQSSPRCCWRLHASCLRVVDVRVFFSVARRVMTAFASNPARPWPLGWSSTHPPAILVDGLGYSEVGEKIDTILCAYGDRIVHLERAAFSRSAERPHWISAGLGHAARQ